MEQAIPKQTLSGPPPVKFSGEQKCAVVAALILAAQSDRPMKPTGLEFIQTISKQIGVEENVVFIREMETLRLKGPAYLCYLLRLMGREAKEWVCSVLFELLNLHGDITPAEKQYADDFLTQIGVHQDRRENIFSHVRQLRRNAQALKLQEKLEKSKAGEQQKEQKNKSVGYTQPQMERFLSFYKREFGERKFQEVQHKILTSNKISGLISTSRYGKVKPRGVEFLYCINSIPYFIFSRGQTQALAGLLAVQRWNEEVNSQLAIASDFEVQAMVDEIIRESKVTFF